MQMQNLSRYDHLEVCEYLNETLFLGSYNRTHHIENALSTIPIHWPE